MSENPTINIIAIVIIQSLFSVSIGDQNLPLSAMVDGYFCSCIVFLVWRKCDSIVLVIPTIPVATKLLC